MRQPGTQHAGSILANAARGVHHVADEAGSERRRCQEEEKEEAPVGEQDRELRRYVVVSCFVTITASWSNKSCAIPITGMTESPLRTVVVHDPTLINAIDRLAGVLSKQLSEMRTNESSSTRHLMSTLTAEVSEMRRRQEDAMERMLDLGERHLKVMEGILQCKLRKEQRASDGVPTRRRVSPPPEQQQQQYQQQQQQQQREP